MKIRLKSFFHLDVANVFEHDQLELPDEGTTIRTLLELITRKSGGAIKAIDPVSDRLDIDYFVLVNGRDLESLPQGLDTQLCDGDEVGMGMNYHWGGG